MSLQTAYERRTEAAESRAHDGSIAHDEAIEAAMNEAWDREYGDHIGGNVIADAVCEVLSAMDEQELGDLGAAFAEGPVSFGDLLMGAVFGYLEARCRLIAEQQLETLQRQAEDEAAAERMAD